MEENLVSQTEGVFNAGFLVDKLEKAVVRDDNQGIDLGHQILKSFLSNLVAMTAFKTEGFGDYGDGQGAALLGYLSYNRDRAGARAAAHTGGDEDHIRTGNCLPNLINAFFSCFVPHKVITAGTKTAGNPLTELYAHGCFSHRQRLGIRIHNDEFNTTNLFTYHAGHGIAAAAAHANDLYLCATGDITSFCHFFLLLSINL
jgi:hypothetical protein